MDKKMKSNINKNDEQRTQDDNSDMVEEVKPNQREERNKVVNNVENLAPNAQRLIDNAEKDIPSVLEISDEVRMRILNKNMENLNKLKGDSKPSLYSDYTSKDSAIPLNILPTNFTDQPKMLFDIKMHHNTNKKINDMSSLMVNFIETPDGVKQIGMISKANEFVTGDLQSATVILTPYFENLMGSGNGDVLYSQAVFVNGSTDTYSRNNDANVRLMQAINIAMNNDIIQGLPSGTVTDVAYNSPGMIALKGHPFKILSDGPPHLYFATEKSFIKSININDINVKIDDVAQIGPINFETIVKNQKDTVTIWEVVPLAVDQFTSYFNNVNASYILNNRMTPQDIQNYFLNFGSSDIRMTIKSPIDAARSIIYRETQADQDAWLYAMSIDRSLADDYIAHTAMQIIQRRIYDTDSGLNMLTNADIKPNTDNRVLSYIASNYATASPDDYIMMTVLNHCTGFITTRQQDGNIGSRLVGLVDLLSLLLFFLMFPMLAWRTSGIGEALDKLLNNIIMDDYYRFIQQYGRIGHLVNGRWVPENSISGQLTDEQIRQGYAYSVLAAPTTTNHSTIHAIQKIINPNSGGQFLLNQYLSRSAFPRLGTSQRFTTVEPLRKPNTTSPFYIRAYAAFKLIKEMAKKMQNKSFVGAVEQSNDAAAFINITNIIERGLEYINNEMHLNRANIDHWINDQTPLVWYTNFDRNRPWENMTRLGLIPQAQMNHNVRTNSPLSQKEYIVDFRMGLQAFLCIQNQYKRPDFSRINDDATVGMEAYVRQKQISYYDVKKYAEFHRARVMHAMKVDNALYILQDVLKERGVVSTYITDLRDALLKGSYENLVKRVLSMMGLTVENVFGTGLVTSQTAMDLRHGSFTVGELDSTNEVSPNNFVNPIVDHGNMALRKKWNVATKLAFEVVPKEMEGFVLKREVRNNMMLEAYDDNVDDGFGDYVTSYSFEHANIKGLNYQITMIVNRDGDRQQYANAYNMRKTAINWDYSMPLRNEDYHFIVKAVEEGRLKIRFPMTYVKYRVMDLDNLVDQRDMSTDAIMELLKTPAKGYINHTFWITNSAYNNATVTLGTGAVIQFLYPLENVDKNEVARNLFDGIGETLDDMELDARNWGIGQLVAGEEYQCRYPGSNQLKINGKIINFFNYVTVFTNNVTTDLPEMVIKINDLDVV